MIGVGGVIGTGLFLGTATALKAGGPLGILLAYLFIGSICFSVMVTIGEMISFLPIAGGHIKLAERFVDPAFSFAMGWNFWYTWTLTLPAELSAAATLIEFWKPGVSNAVWITICIAVAIGINLSGVGVYGEAEFLFASIKVVTIVGLIILGIVLDLGGGPTHDRIGFRYWKDPGPFASYDGISGVQGQFIGWSWAVTQAAFSYTGTEIVAIAAAEAKNPRRNLPKAIRRVYLRICLFYIGGVFIIGLLVPSNEPLLNLNAANASASPFVIAMNQAGIKALPSIINAALLTSAWSAASGDLYISSRGLYGLAISGNAPKIFLRTSRSGLPYVSVFVCSAFCLFAYMVVGTSSGEVFTWFSSMTATCGLVTWSGIGVIYVRFRKGFLLQGHDRSKLPYASRFQPFAAWWAIIASAVTLLFSGWEVFLNGSWSIATFLTNYLPPILFLILYVGSKYYRNTHHVKPSEMDFKSDIAEIEAITYEDPTPKNWLEAFWIWLM
ncbi:amino acid permease/ SLC12A domain-containing protein [Hygrophoropsis aurantiaca]|uniref:Amino acid permease/ SLC12A domain-containing protein n=1 Tax=Hygrophoropsis aurantiaca TaxID=72124 RepID=A0ACB8AB52_9AGAM|nr:amino acid permease/ SLC12A domain-containing protein [Hygrophoropsis aurantiaca]